MIREEAKQKFLKLYCKNRAFCELYPEHCKEDKCEIYHALKALEAEPSGNEYNGHWVQSKNGHGCECSECGTAYRWIEADTMRYCPSCGAKMGGGEE